MSAEDRSARASMVRLVAVGALSIINVALIVGILQKNSVFPFESVETAANGVEADEAGAGGEAATGETLVTTQQSPDLLSTDSVTSVGTGANAQPGTDTGTAEPFDDWPGGHGPVPDGPPVPRQVLVDDSGLLVLTGSVPSWAVATEIVNAAGARLPGGVGSVDNQLTWHPDASDRLEGGTVRLDPAVLYPSGSTAVPEEAKAGLDRVAEILAANQSVFAVIIAHTDDLGDTEENSAVAFTRATGVVDYLQSKGANLAQIVIASAGSGEPVASNETEEGRTLNRRVEIQFEGFLTPGPAGGS